ncbi:MAG: histidine kinase [Pseudomonadota bacterium]|nr:histidine kinase [Pseudomonadota bacterium]
MRVGKPAAVLALTILLATLFASGANALDPHRTIAQYKHTRWTVTGGAPPLIFALAQGRDGYLWIGSSTGLYRFDGATFEKISLAPPSTDAQRVSALLAAGDGTIWAGYSNGKIAAYRDGVLRLDQSIPKHDAYVMNFAQTADGVVWVALGRPERALLRYHGGRWQEVGVDWALPPEWLIDIFAARDGSLWLTTVQSVLVLRKGSRRFEHVGTPHGHASVSQDPAGRIWLSDDRGTRVLSGQPPAGAAGIAFPTPGSKRNIRARFDRDGNLWGVNADGLFRLKSPAALRDRSPASLAGYVERFMAKDGLTSDSTVPILEDREGNIWVGTSLGLDRFRTANVVVEPGLKKAPTWGFFLHTASDGSVYVGTADAIYRVPPGGNPQPIARQVPDTDAICESGEGTVWVFLRDRLLRVRDRAVARVALPKGVATGGQHRCMVDDRDVLWVNSGRGGLHSYAAGEWRHHPPGPNERWASSLIQDNRRRPLALLKAGLLVRLDRTGKPAQLLLRHDSASVSMMTHGRRDLFVGGSFGVGRVRQGRLETADSTRFPWLADVSGLAETPGGQTWLMTGAGIVGLPSSDLERAFVNRKAALRPLVLDFEDGLPNLSSRSGVNDVARGGDGRLWFSTLGGVVWVDPGRIVRNTFPPPVVVRSLTAQGRSWRDPRRLNLAKGTSTLAIQYAGLSLSIPERVRFRYRLEGVDERWVDAGNRREAHYTNLGPGNYRFRVLASNNDGVWNEEGATIEFAIPPTFVQSIWFKLLALLSLGLLAWGAWTFRLRQVTAQLQNRFDVRIAERERIARELHDTLLQGFQGLVLRFQSVANRIPDGGLRASIDDALDRADAVLVEGRARVRELRTGTGDRDLAQALLDSAADAVEGDAPRVQLTVEGSPRPLHPIVREEAQRIGEEAIRNAVQHARAEEIELLLTYGRRELQMIVRDDGIGMPETVLSNGRRAGRYGLIGMRERAEHIGGRLAVISREDRGTEVALTLPAQAAYADGRRGPLGRLRAALSGKPKS